MWFKYRFLTCLTFESIARALASFCMINFGCQGPFRWLSRYIPTYLIWSQIVLICNHWGVYLYSNLVLNLVFEIQSFVFLVLGDLLLARNQFYKSFKSMLSCFWTFYDNYLYKGDLDHFQSDRVDCVRWHWGNLLYQ